MTPRRFRAAGSLLAFLFAATPAVAQMALPATQRGVPAGPASADPIALSLADAVARGLERYWLRWHPAYQIAKAQRPSARSNP